MGEPMVCDREGCYGAAEFKVGMLFRAPEEYKDAPPATARTSLCVCADCRANLVPTDLITDEGWALVATQFKLLGKICPARELTVLTFERIDDV